MRIVLLAMIVLVPLIFMPGVFFHFNTTPKVAVLLFAVPVLFIFRKQNVKNIRALWSTKGGRIATVLLSAQCAAGGLSALASANPALSMNGSLWRRSGWITETALGMFAFFAAAWLSGDHRRQRMLLRVSAAAGAAASIYGICQYFGRDPFLPANAYQAGEGMFRIMRPPGTLGHADYFACWLLMVIFPAAALARIEVRKLPRIACSSACAVIAIAILLTGTRAAWLGLVAGLAFLLALKRFRVSAAAWTIGAALAASLVVFAISPAGTRLRARLHWAMDDAGGGARLLLWRDSLRMAAHRPWLGFGEETFTTQFPRFASIDLARAYPDFYQESPHNTFLDALDSCGVPGLACLLGLAVLGFAVGWRARRAGNPMADPLLAGWIATLVCLQFTVLVVATALYFYLSIAMLISLRAPPIASASPGRAASAYWIAAVASLFLPVFAARLIVSDRLLAMVRQRIETGDAGGAALAYASVLRWLPSGAGFDLFYSRAMARLAERSPVFAVRMTAWAEAKESGARAISSAEDRQNAWYSLAALYAAENNATGAEVSLRNAIACAPNWFKPHWTLAKLLELTGRHREAVMEAGTAVERDASRDPEVIATWKALSARAP